MPTASPTTTPLPTASTPTPRSRTSASARKRPRKKESPSRSASSRSPPPVASDRTSPASGEVKAPINPNALELTKGNRDYLLGLHRQMQFIRRFEERTQEQYTKAKIGGYCHLNIGEEATVVGGIRALKPNDYIFTSYREHGHAIARGIDPKAVMAELFGKETGTSHGRGGSMHMFDADLRFMGGYGIVGGHLPLAVGGGWAGKYRKEKAVGFCMVGDGVTNIGAFHESLNL